MPLAKLEVALGDCSAEVNALYARCREAAPNYSVSPEDFLAALRAAVDKYLIDHVNGRAPSADQVRQFLGELQTQDLYLALACAQGNEHAWWEFDQSYRPFIERIARHLASAEVDAEEVIDSVYVELFGTRVVDGVRQSKFATYTGRGTLRGWLRTVVWHAVIDMHRARRDEISVDDWTESGGETQDRPGWRAEARGGEATMVDRIARERYRAATLAALSSAMAALDDHEKLLLLYYHVEGLKLREIARLVEEPASPLRRWFQRQSKRRANAPESRVHESTVMRWLEKVYAKVLDRFRTELEKKGGLSPAEIDVCIGLATEDLAPEDVRRHLKTESKEGLSKAQTEEPSI
ncbi:MAG TPA: sigma-70 family RNA polymerase sigma factor [Pyrinomonadaceae bacterium]|nr:sigma-70 family RNA polymerase sigma factor [Pyrinomonadaceae bacterium]